MEQCIPKLRYLGFNSTVYINKFFFGSREAVVLRLGTLRGLKNKLEKMNYFLVIVFYKGEVEKIISKKRQPKNIILKNILFRNYKK